MKLAKIFWKKNPEPEREIKPEQRILMPKSKRIATIRNVVYRCQKNASWLSGTGIVVEHSYENGHKIYSLYCHREHDKKAYVPCEVVLEGKRIMKIEINNGKVIIKVE